MERLSWGTGMTAAMSQGNRLAGTVMWMPLAGRIACGSRPSSRALTSSAQTPDAFTTIRARTGNSDVASSATARTMAPSAVPSGPVVRRTTGV